MEKDYFVLKVVKPQFPFKLVEFLKRNNFDAYYRSNKNVFIKIYFENNYSILEEDILEEMEIAADNIEDFIFNNFHYNYYIEPVFYHKKRR